MEQHELRSPRGARRPRKRVGRGNASGHGTYSGRGIKGQQARSGSGPSHGFEGGQTPLIRRLPRRRGFRNPFRVAYTPVNLRDLAKLPAGSEVTPESLQETGVVRSLRHPIKLLADGDVAAALTVRAHRVSAAARVKIEAAGGSVEELTPRPPKAEEAETSAAQEDTPTAEAETSVAQEDTPTAEAATSEAKAKRRPKKGAAQEDTPTAEAATSEAKAKRRPKKGAAQPDAIGEEPTPEPEPASEE